MDETFLIEENTNAESSFYQQEESRISQIIEAIDSLLKRNEWNVLSELHFKPEQERIERLMLSRAKEENIKQEELYRLQGELKWAKRYADIYVFADTLKKQLINIRKNIKK